MKREILTFIMGVCQNSQPALGQLKILCEVQLLIAVMRLPEGKRCAQDRLEGNDL